MSQYVPEQFWTNAVAPTLEEAIKTYENHSDQINKSSYLTDFLQVLVTFAIKNTMPKDLQNKVLRFLDKEVSEFNCKNCEQSLFVFYRCQLADRDFLKNVMDKIAAEKYLEKNEM